MESITGGCVYSWRQQRQPVYDQVESWDELGWSSGRGQLSVTCGLLLKAADMQQGGEQGPGVGHMEEGRWINGYTGAGTDSSQCWQEQVARLLEGVRVPHLLRGAT